MKALVKRKSEPGLWLEEVEKPALGINDVMIRVASHGNLRHRCSYLQMGRLGSKDDSGSHGRRT